MQEPIRIGMQLDCKVLVNIYQTRLFVGTHFPFAVCLETILTHKIGPYLYIRFKAIILRRECTYVT